MAGREKRRRATALDDDERRGRRRTEEAALILHKIKGGIPLSSPQSLVNPRNPLRTVASKRS
jgi:hypothetical protein